jgi:hypothetical protein
MRYRGSTGADRAQHLARGPVLVPRGAGGPRPSACSRRSRVGARLSRRRRSRLKVSRCLSLVLLIFPLRIRSQSWFSLFVAFRPADLLTVNSYIKVRLDLQADKLKDRYGEPERGE